MQRTNGEGRGPELALVGGARSGTSFLAAYLADHPDVDLSSVKEPNFFSRHYDRGFDWYAEHFAAPRPGVVRMDASTTYTFPQFPDALPRLAKADPNLVVYVVRDPLERAYSHYRHNRHYFEIEDADDFGAAVRDNPLFLGTSDFTHWLSKLHELFDDDRVLVAPFDLISEDCAYVASTICGKLGLDPWINQSQDNATAHKNNVVSFRNGALRVISDKMRQSSVYPAVRKTIGPARIRKIRSMLTKEIPAPTLEEALAGCDASLRDELAAFSQATRAAVDAELAAQDERLGLDWRSRWTR